MLVGIQVGRSLFMFGERLSKMAAHPRAAGQQETPLMQELTQTAALASKLASACAAAGGCNQGSLWWVDDCDAGQVLRSRDAMQSSPKSMQSSLWSRMGLADIRIR